MPDKLKKGWTRVAFGDVVRLCRERSSDPLNDGFERYVGLEHLDPEELKIRRWGNVEDGTTFTSVFRAGQVLFGKRRAYQRKLAVPDFDGVCSGDIYVLEPKNEHLLPELLPFICKTDSFFDHAVGTSAGSLSPRTNWKSLAEYEFALPPLDEQKKIVKLINSFIYAKESVNSALGCTFVMQKSLLNHYFSFRSQSSTTVSLGSLVKNKEVEFQTGPFGTILAAREYSSVGWPIINPVDMVDGEIRHSGGPYVDDEIANRLNKHRLMKGDILLARKGDFSKSVIASEYNIGWIGGSDTIRLRSISKRIVPEYLYLCIQAPKASQLLNSYSHGTVMPGINEKVLSKLVIDLKSDNDQKKIVNYFFRLKRAQLNLKERCVMLDNIINVMDSIYKTKDSG